MRPSSHRRCAILRVHHGAVAAGVGRACTGIVVGVGVHQVHELQECEDDHERFLSFL